MIGVSGFSGAFSFDDEWFKFQFCHEASGFILGFGFSVPHNNIYGFSSFGLDGMFHGSQGDPAHVCHRNVIKAADRKITGHFILHVKKSIKNTQGNHVVVGYKRSGIRPLREDFFGEIKAAGIFQHIGRERIIFSG